MKKLALFISAAVLAATTSFAATLLPLRTSPTHSVPVNDVPAFTGGTVMGSGSTQFDVLNKSHRARVGIAGGKSNPVRITAATITVADTDISSVTSVEVLITRPMGLVSAATNTRSYDILLSGSTTSSGNLVSQLTRSTVSRVVFPTPITNAALGDYPRIRIQAATIPAMLYRVSLRGDIYRGNFAPTQTAYNWEDAIAPLATNTTSMQLYSDTGVHAVFDGTSIIGGSPGNRGFYDFTATLADPYVTIADHLRTLADNELTYSVVSVAGSKVADQAARFDAYVAAMLPRYLVADYLPNDIGNTAKETAFASLTSILDKCVSNGIIPILLLTPPNSGQNNTWHNTREDWNASVVALKSSYPSLVTVSVDDVVGTFMAGGPAGNKRAVQTWANSGDGIHFSAMGYAAIAKEIAKAMGWYQIDGIVYGSSPNTNVYGRSGLSDSNMFK